MQQPVLGSDTAEVVVFFRTRSETHDGEFFKHQYCTYRPISHAQEMYVLMITFLTLQLQYFISQAGDLAGAVPRRIQFSR